MRSLLLLISSIFFDPVIVEDHFDIIEINTIRQKDGSTRLKQYIWWEHDDNLDVCAGWMDFKRVGKMPVRVGNHYEVVWWDGRLCRRVTCQAFMGDLGSGPGGGQSSTGSPDSSPGAK